MYPMLEQAEGNVEVNCVGLLTAPNKHRVALGRLGVATALSTATASSAHFTDARTVQAGLGGALTPFDGRMWPARFARKTSLSDARVW